MSRTAVIADVIRTQARQLKMPGLARSFEDLARQSREEHWAPEDYLHEVLSVEIASRSESAVKQRLHSAAFPEMKTLDQFDFAATEGVAAPKIADLARGDWIARAENVILAGPIGTGNDLTPNSGPLRLRVRPLMSTPRASGRQGSVRPDLVVIPPPVLDLGLCVAETGEPVIVQALVAEPPVEGLDVAVLDRLSGSDEVDGHARGIGPRVEGLPCELRAVVADDDRWSSSRCEHALKHTYNPCTADRRVDLDGQAFPGEVVDDVAGAESAAARERVEGEVHRPPLVRSAGRWQHRAQADSHSLPLSPSDSQTLGPVDAIDALVIHMPSAAHQQRP